MMEDVDLCAKLDKLLLEKDFEVISIVVVNGTEVAYCVDLEDVWCNKEAPLVPLKLVDKPYEAKVVTEKAEKVETKPKKGK
jgi:hypothetical protein